MTTYYRVIRSVEQKDLDTASPDIAEILRMISAGGSVTFEHFRFNKKRVMISYY